MSIYARYNTSYEGLEKVEKGDYITDVENEDRNNKFNMEKQHNITNKLMKIHRSFAEKSEFGKVY